MGLAFLRGITKWYSCAICISIASIVFLWVALRSSDLVRYYDAYEEAGSAHPLWRAGRSRLRLLRNSSAVLSLQQLSTLGRPDLRRSVSDGRIGGPTWVEVKPGSQS